MSQSSSPAGFRVRAAAALVAVGLSALSLSACHLDDSTSDPAVAADYHLHYPIQLTDAKTTMEVFAPNGRLDEQSLASIRAFADRYREYGASRIAILAPANHRNVSTLGAIRKALYADGLRGYVAIGSYPGGDGAAAAPVRLVYLGLTAKVFAQCGQFPSDLASGDDLKEWNNLPYENYGCATEKMLAAQVDDPRDFVRARAVTEPDVEMRLRAIDDVRKGADPGTSWKVQNTAIGQVGGS